MKKSIISEEKIKKFDDVHIKSMNLTGMVYAIKGNDVVVNTLKKGLVKAKLDDLKKLYTDSVNEDFKSVVGKTVFSDGKGKLHFGYYKEDDSAYFVDYKTWAKLGMKDVSKGDTNKDKVINAILRNQKQFNKKVEYNMWAKKTNPSFEEKMDWFIKNGWISNITKAGIKEGVESVNEAWDAKNGKVMFNGKAVGEYDFDTDSDSFWVMDLEKGKGQKSFDTKQQMIDYFKKHKKNESVNELNLKSVGVKEFLQQLIKNQSLIKKLGFRTMKDVLAYIQGGSVEDWYELKYDGKKLGMAVNEAAMSDIDIIAKEATDFKDFVKQFYAEYSDFPKNKESLKWLEDIYKGRTKMEGLERVATALPQTEEEPVTEGDEKSPEEILMGLKEMAKGDLERISDYANMILERLNKGEELSSWMYSQITLAVDQLNSVHDALDGKDGVVESVNEHKDCGCGCGGTTVGGCNTSLTEEKLNEWRAEEVLQQLGGRKFIAMTGAKNFVKNDKEKSITFKIGGGAKNSINYVKITLTSMDVYNVDFIRVRGTDIKTIATAKGVYNDQLQSIFTKYTGLYTSL